MQNNTISDVPKFFINFQLNGDSYLNHWSYGCEIINMFINLLYTVIINDWDANMWGNVKDLYLSTKDFTKIKQDNLRWQK